jgi:hypothetical protein
MWVSQSPRNANTIVCGLGPLLQLGYVNIKSIPPLGKLLVYGVFATQQPFIYPNGYPQGPIMPSPWMGEVSSQSESFMEKVRQALENAQGDPVLASERLFL